FWMNSEVMALTFAAQQVTSNVVGRERPYGRACASGEVEPQSDHCEGRDRYRSYFSGHTSVPFALATAQCVHHARVGLSGSRPWIPCVLGLAVAATSGTLRIVSDYHYATDVVSGAMVGTLIGLGVPLLHYTTGLTAPEARFAG